MTYLVLWREGRKIGRRTQLSFLHHGSTPSARPFIGTARDARLASPSSPFRESTGTFLHGYKRFWRRAWSLISSEERERCRLTYNQLRAHQHLTTFGVWNASFMAEIIRKEKNRRGYRAYFKCDMCEKDSNRPFSDFMKYKIHFCSSACAQKSLVKDNPGYSAVHKPNAYKESSETTRRQNLC